MSKNILKTSVEYDLETNEFIRGIVQTADVRIIAGTYEEHCDNLQTLVRNHELDIQVPFHD